MLIIFWSIVMQMLKIKDNIYLSLAWRTFWGKSDKMSIVDVQSVDKSTDQCSSVIVWKF